MKTVVIAAALTLAAAPAADAATWKQVTAERRGGHRPGRAGTHQRRRAPCRLAQGPRSRPHRDLPRRPDRHHVADPVRLDRPPGRRGHCRPGGLRASGARIRTKDTNDPNQDLNTALSTDGGMSWRLTPGSIIPRGAQAYRSDAARPPCRPARRCRRGRDARDLGARGPRPGDPEHELPWPRSADYGNYPGSRPTRAAARRWRGSPARRRPRACSRRASTPTGRRPAR